MMTDAELNAEIRKARDGIPLVAGYHASDRAIARHFYALAAERCAAACEDQSSGVLATLQLRTDFGMNIATAQAMGALNCAAACRAIGETT